VNARSSPWRPILAGLIVGALAALAVSLARADSLSAKPARLASEPTSSASEQGRASGEEAAMEAELVLLTNVERSRAGLPELKTDPHLTAAARAHSEVMAQHRLLAHDVPGEADLSRRVAAAGSRFDFVAENVSVTNEANPAQTAHRGLMSSPPHRANILGRDYNAIGVGVVRRGSEYYITEDFAHVFASMSAGQTEDAVARVVNELRHRQGLVALRVVRLDRLDLLACRPGVTLSQLLQDFPSSHGAVIFTVFEPANLPKSLTQMALDSGITALSLRACPVGSERGGNGGFRMAAVFF
jgi:uncharacterized protein YkwD